MNILQWLLGKAAYRAIGLMGRDLTGQVRREREALERARLTQLADANWRFDRVG
jgi:hypothetical protein